MESQRKVDCVINLNRDLLAVLDFLTFENGANELS
jgi:hypothetical protein